MLVLDLEEFMIELKEGAVKNVGPANKRATVKLFDVESATAEEFGDRRIKLIFHDEEGDEVQVALFPETVEGLTEQLETLRSESVVFD
ncbi:MAG: hypothetical protein U5K37_09140 [Natrialbaceae archaeon]|nr:hypothetical protein [Natrialbaceae archaeon]